MTQNTKSFAHETYNIEYWSEGYFNIDNSGNVILGDKIFTNINGKKSADPIKLEDIITEAKKQNLDLPLLLRFPDILQLRLKELTQAFKKAFVNNNYHGNYLPAYPIKVNQQRSVIDGFLSHLETSNDYPIALEVGSKPELFICTALAAKYNLEVICSGYKDEDYIKLALYGQHLGINVNIIVEKLSELNLVLELSKKLNIAPRLGVRVRLSSLGKGNWQNTGGVKSKFGLTSLQLLTFIEQLKNTNNLDKLKVMHFHMGSQIADLADIQSGLKEAVRLYAEINRSGARLEAIDIGGGLGVDYEGTCSRSYCSVNYNLDLYANTVVRIVREICDQDNLPHPNIITESGRAMTAHHAVLVTDIIDIEPVIPELSLPVKKNNNKTSIAVDLENCITALKNESRRAIEIYHQAKMNFNLTQELYINGAIHLPERAEIEQLYYKICLILIKVLDPKVHNHRKLLDILNEDMANKIFCNFSLFQSIPDVWGIDQLFPIMPLSGLDQLDSSTNMRGLLQDMTCDSDGRINKYIDGQGVESSLPLPFTKETQANPYNIGFFMVGAYQEILGDLHNLFGDTATVDVKIHENGFDLVNQKCGDSIAAVLKYVDFDANVFLDELLTKYNYEIKDSDQLASFTEFLSAYIKNTPYYNS